MTGKFIKRFYLVIDVFYKRHCVILNVVKDLYT